MLGTYWYNNKKKYRFLPTFCSGISPTHTQMALLQKLRRKRVLQLRSEARFVQ
jgi:hypothetical protein